MIRLSLKKKEAMESVEKSLKEFSQKAKQESEKSIRQAEEASIKWASGLLKTYRQKYKNYFDSAEQEFKIHAENVNKKIQINKASLQELKELQHL